MKHSAVLLQRVSPMGTITDKKIDGYIGYSSSLTVPLQDNLTYVRQEHFQL